MRSDVSGDAEVFVTAGPEVRARNNVRVSGNGGGPALLFAHGFGCDQNMWRFVAPSFEDDHQVVLFDYVGCGRSDPRAYDPARYDGLEGYTQDVLDVCAALDLRGAVFVGHSVSAMIGVLAAIREPDRFSRLILVAPSPRFLNDPPVYEGGFERADLAGLLEMMDKNYLGWASAFAPVVMGGPGGAAGAPEAVGELEQSFCSTDPVTARRFAEVTFFSDNRADLPLCPAPSLILQCSDDLLAPRSVGEYLHRHLPRSTLRVLDASGHCPHMTHPTETARLIREYLTAGGS